VPIVEPEVLPDGDHDLHTARRVTEDVSHRFTFLFTLTLLSADTFRSSSGVRDIWAPPFGRRRLGAAVWALTVWATGHMGAGTNRRRRFGAGRFGATVTFWAWGATVTFFLASDCCPNATYINAYERT